MQLSALVSLAHERGANDPAATEWQLIQRGGPYASFGELDRAWHWKNALLRHPDDFRLIATSAAARLRDDGVAYAEMSFCPSDFAHTGLGEAALLEAVRRGLDSVSSIEVALIVDLGRDRGPRHAARQVEVAAELMQHGGIIGIGMGGLHGDHSTADFAGVYALARRRGLRTTVHAGEIDGPDGVASAVRALQPDRIGHGTSAIHDRSVVELLVAERIPLEVCPSSNVHTRSVADYASHPMRRFFDAGVSVSLNTDDPVMFGTSLSAEYALAGEQLGFDDEQLLGVLQAGIEASWASDERKARLRALLDAAGPSRRGAQEGATS